MLVLLLQNFFNVILKPFRSENHPRLPCVDVHLTEILSPNDPRTALFDSAKKKKIKVLIDRGTWKIICKDEVPNNASILGGRFVLAIRDAGTNREIWKARFVVQGFRNKLKELLVHDTSTARQYSTRILVGLTSVFGFGLFSTDVTQAYLQNAEKLLRDVYVKQSKDIETSPNQIFKLMKPLYGRSDSGDYWGRTIHEHLKGELELNQTTNDAAFSLKSLGDKLSGLCVTYVDDLLQAGDKDFAKLAEKTEKRFKCKPREWDSFQFSGMQLETTESEY